jgi:hypothetical protein
VTIREFSRSIAALGTLTAAVLVAYPARAVDGVIEINQARAVAGSVTPGDGPGFPVLISASGSYRLTSNLSVTPGQDGIDVTAGHVTLDLNGFSITGGGGGIADGVSLQGVTNVTVKNGSILGFTRSGIFSGVATNYVRVLGITAIGNAIFGIDLEGVGGVIDGCTTLDNNTGMRVVDGSRVVNSISRGNTSYGLFLSGGSGYGSNVLSGNNGGNINPQVSGGFQLGTNICGAGTTCP